MIRLNNYLDKGERRRLDLARVMELAMLYDYFERRKEAARAQYIYRLANRAVGEQLRPLCDTWSRRVGKGIFPIKIDLAEWIVGKRFDTIGTDGFLVGAGVHINDVERLAWSTLALRFRAVRSANGKYVVIKSAWRTDPAAAYKG